MAKRPTSSDSFFKKPSLYEQKLGKLSISIEIKDVDNLSATSVAMDRLAKAKQRDDVIRSSGRNDYALSLEKLFNAFDTFIREYSRRRHTAGSRGMYDLSKPHHLTILLLWQIRHTWTHHGGVIDDRCKREYEKTMGDAHKKRINPRIHLPLSLPINFEFSIDFDNYSIVEQCIFEYIGKKIPKEDLEILKIRASVADLRCEGIKAHLRVPQGHFLIDLREALDCGCSIDPITKRFTAPSEGVYNATTKRVTLKASGKSFYAEKLPNN